MLKDKGTYVLQSKVESNVRNHRVVHSTSQHTENIFEVKRLNPRRITSNGQVFDAKETLLQFLNHMDTHGTLETYGLNEDGEVMYDRKGDQVFPTVFPEGFYEIYKAMIERYQKCENQAQCDGSGGTSADTLFEALACYLCVPYEKYDAEAVDPQQFYKCKEK